MKYLSMLIKGDAFLRRLACISLIFLLIVQFFYLKDVIKTYHAKVKGHPAEEKLTQLRRGIALKDGVTAPAEVKYLGYDELKDVSAVEISIHEGKNRQVRRMFETIGHPVKTLKRVKYAFLTLEGLKRGQYRYLLPNEISRLKQLM